MKTVQTYCKEFRESLGITLSQMELVTGVKMKTISAFENNRSNNLNHIQLYFVIAKDRSKTNEFLNGLNSNIIERGYNV